MCAQGRKHICAAGRGGSCFLPARHLFDISCFIFKIHADFKIFSPSLPDTHMHRNGELFHDFLVDPSPRCSISFFAVTAQPGIL